MGVGILTCQRHAFALALRAKHWRGCGLRRWGVGGEVRNVYRVILTFNCGQCDVIRCISDFRQPCNPRADRREAKKNKIWDSSTLVTHNGVPSTL